VAHRLRELADLVTDGVERTSASGERLGSPEIRRAIKRLIGTEPSCVRLLPIMTAQHDVELRLEFADGRATKLILDEATLYDSLDRFSKIVIYPALVTLGFTPTTNPEGNSNGQDEEEHREEAHAP
jgi:hypothetical protein